MDVLVGKTGFVGGNLLRSHAFSGAYHSADIAEAYGTRPELLVYAGVRAEKFMADCDEVADWEQVSQALKNITEIQPQRLVLISTVDVIAENNGADEDTICLEQGLTPYGRNRLRLEQEIRSLYPQALIMRLPALFGWGLKKNFLYDFLTLVPSRIIDEKYNELAEKSAIVKASYAREKNGFWRCRVAPPLWGYKEEYKRFIALQKEFIREGFTSLSFTDSRAQYQFYPLERLWADIGKALSNNIRLLHLATAPVNAGEIVKRFGESWENRLSRQIPHYDFRSKYSTIFGGENGYFLDAESELGLILKFLHENMIFKGGV